MYLFVKPNGSRLWQMKYRFSGKEKVLSLGVYPQVTLQEAREERDKARKLLSLGQDPSLAKQEKKRLSAVSAANTFEAVAMEWHQKNKGKWSENHAGTVLRRLERDIFPAIGNVPIKDITTPRLALVIEGIEKRGAHDVARRALQYCRAVFSYAAVTGRVQSNPAIFKASDILTSYKKGHFAAMEAKDLPAFLAKLYSNEARLFRQTQLAMELMMLTFVRTNELIKAQWSEFDFEKRIWLIPAKRMKMKRDHIVPLSKQAMEILEELKIQNGHRPYVFSGQRNPKEHMSNGGILMALDRMGYRGVHTGHGFRALAMSTIMEELEYPYDVVDVQLAHGKKSDVEAAYNRARYIKQRTQMMQDWADYIERLAASGKVITGNFKHAF
jgi:integrase